MRDTGASIAGTMDEMERGLLARLIDRAVANARVIRGAPEAIALTAIIAVGVSYFGFQQFPRERVAALHDTIAAQERLLADYRTKQKGVTPDEAAAQIEILTSLLADAQKSLSVATSKPVPVENRAR